MSELTLKMGDIDVGLSLTRQLQGGLPRLHIRDPKAYPLSFCKATLVVTEKITVLVDLAPESWSHELPDGTVYKGPISEVKHGGIKLCANCLRCFKKESRKATKA